MQTCLFIAIKYIIFLEWCIKSMSALEVYWHSYLHYRFAIIFALRSLFLVQTRLSKCTSNSISYVWKY